MKCSECGSNNTKVEEFYFNIFGAKLRWNDILKCKDCGFFCFLFASCDEPACEHCNPSLEQQKEIESKIVFMRDKENAKG